VIMPTKLATRRKSPMRRIPIQEFSDDIYTVGLPQYVESRLSGIGELPALAPSVTLADIQRAIRTSEIGEPYFLFALYRDMVESSSHLQAEIGKRIMSFVGQDETIKPKDKKKKDDVIAAEIIEDMISNCDNWIKGSLHLANGHIWPTAGAEKIYAPMDEGLEFEFRHPVKWRLKKLFPMPWQLFTYKVAYNNLAASTGDAPGRGILPQYTQSGLGVAPNQDQVLHSAAKLEPADNSGNPLVWDPDDWNPDLRFYSTFNNGLINWDLSVSRKPDPIRHVIHSANVATASMRENFGSLLRSVLPWWFFASNLRDWWARGMERYGSPFSVAYANTANKNVFDLLTKAFNQATKINALIVPPQSKIELKEIQYTSMADAYAKSVEVCDTQMTKAVLGQTLSTTSKGSGMMGGSGVADLHSEVRSDWVVFDKRAYGDMQVKQIFTPFLRINGYKGNVKVVRGGISPINQSMFAKTLQSAALAGAFPAPESEDELSEIFGIPMSVKDITQKNGDKQQKSKSDRKRNK
jgi:hypothetical protein